MRRTHQNKSNVAEGKEECNTNVFLSENVRNKEEEKMFGLPDSFILNKILRERSQEWERI